nr:uncharacterized protein LOC123569808 isoform X1 [Macaca fascicularis]
MAVENLERRLLPSSIRAERAEVPRTLQQVLRAAPRRPRPEGEARLGAEGPQRPWSARCLWVPPARALPPLLSSASQRGRRGESWAGKAAAPAGDKGPGGLWPLHFPAPPGPHIENSSSSAGEALNDWP